MEKKYEIRKFAQLLLARGRNYQPGQTDRDDFRKALIYIMEITDDQPISRQIPVLE